MEPKATYDEMKRSELERTWDTRWRQFAPSLPDYEREYRFFEPRKWRFDCAWPAPIYVAVELDGGTWSGGRHTRGQGYRNDCEKRNCAQCLGWVVFNFTADMLRDNPEHCVRQVVAAVERRL